MEMIRDYNGIVPGLRRLINIHACVHRSYRAGIVYPVIASNLIFAELFPVPAGLILDCERTLG